jgi:hypothetical protein
MRHGDRVRVACSIVHLYGTPYEMGFAHGTLMKEDANAFLGKAW